MPAAEVAVRLVVTELDRGSDLAQRGEHPVAQLDHRGLVEREEGRCRAELLGLAEWLAGPDPGRPGRFGGGEHGDPERRAAAEDDRFAAQLGVPPPRRHQPQVGETSAEEPGGHRSYPAAAGSSPGTARGTAAGLAPGGGSSPWAATPASEAGGAPSPGRATTAGSPTTSPTA